MTHIKQWFTLHLSIILSVLHVFSPSIQQWVSAHPKTLAATFLATVLTSLLKASPVTPKVS